MADTFNHLGPQAMLETTAAQAERQIAIPPSAGGMGELKASVRKPFSHEVSPDGRGGAPALPLIRRLCEELQEQNVVYCHWKSNWKLARWMSGEGDLDLLVDRADAQRFAGIVYRLGFKRAEPSSDRQMPGILNFYGFDDEASKFVHLHVHYQLVLGHDLTKNYHLPIERPYLESAVRQGLLPVPAPEFELITFVLRMVLKYSASETILSRMFRRSAGPTSAVEKELEYLEAKANRLEVRTILERHLPFIDAVFFDRGVQSLRAGSPVWTRTAVRQELKSRLCAHARRPQTVDALLKVGRRVARVLRERVFRQTPRKRLVNGGALIALVGGDGAGKSTCVNELGAWLSKKFAVKRFHLGRPPRSLLTLAVIIALRVRRLLHGGFQGEPNARPIDGSDPRVFPGYLQLLRWVCAARDRRRAYVKARRFATNGGISICDRYMIPQIRLMDGPNIARSVEPARINSLIKVLLRAETKYYRHIMPPDLLIVLRVDPEVAVQRKTDENESHVRTRSRELWELDWRDTCAHVVDAGQTREDVMAQLRSLVWARI